MALGKVLEDNKKLGQRRVESWRLSKQLEEVAWVFSTLCATIPAAKVDAGLPAWRGDECATFVANLGLGQYAPSFAFNLNGARLPSLPALEMPRGLPRACAQRPARPKSFAGCPTCGPGGRCRPGNAINSRRAAETARGK